MTLLQIYQAVNETATPRIFDPSDKCVVGRHIQPVLTKLFTEVEDVFSHALADCIGLIRKRVSAQLSGR